MKRVTIIFLLVMFCIATSADENVKETNLSLELTSKTHTLRVGHGATVELKIAGQAITEIIKDMNNIKPSIFNKKPEFIYKFTFLSAKEGDYSLGPYSLLFNGVKLESNSLTFKVLPEWDGDLGTIFRVDCNEIYLGESFELVMETWSKEHTKFNISASYNPEHASIETGVFRNKTSIKNSEERNYCSKSWIITPKSAGDFYITKEFFKEFPDGIEPPQLKVLVK